MTSLSCCSVQAALGWAVTFTCARRRVPCSMTTNTYSSRNVAVTATKKSHARMAVAWFFRNVDQRWSPRGCPGARFGMYLRTVRGEIANPQLEQQLVGDPLFTPQTVLVRHPADQRAQLLGNRRPATSRLHSPQQPPARAMPANHGCRLHDDKRAAPIEQPRQNGQADAGRSIYPPRPHATLDVQRELAAQEEVLGSNGLGRAEQQHHPPEGVLDQTTIPRGR